MERMCFNNSCFLDNVSSSKNLKDKIVNLKIDVTTDEEDAQSMNAALGLEPKSRPSFSGLFGSGNSTEGNVINSEITTKNKLKMPNHRVDLTETPKSTTNVIEEQKKIGGITRNPILSSIVFGGTIGIPSSSLSTLSLASTSVLESLMQPPMQDSDGCMTDMTTKNTENDGVERMFLDMWQQYI